MAARTESQWNRTTAACFVVFIDDVVDNLNGTVLITVYVMAAIFIMVANTMMIIGLWKTSRKFTMSKALFFCLSVTDFSTGLLTAPFQLSMVIIGSSCTCFLVGAQAFFNAFTPVLGMLILLAISFTRHTIITKSRLSFLCGSRLSSVKLSAIFYILFAMAFSLWYVFVSQTIDTSHHAIFLLLSAAICVFTLTTILAINIRLLLFLNVTDDRRNMVKNHQNIIQYQHKVTKTLLIISVILIVCYIPTIVAFCVTAYFLLSNDLRRTYYHYIVPWAHVPLVLNSGMNSVVYMIRNSRIRNYWKQFLCERQATLSAMDTESYVTSQFPNRLSTKKVIRAELLDYSDCGLEKNTKL